MIERDFRVLEWGTRYHAVTGEAQRWVRGRIGGHVEVILPITEEEFARIDDTIRPEPRRVLTLRVEAGC